MDYKLNLLTPSVYSQEGKDNCIDHNVEEFASYVKDRADNEFLLPCKYERIPGSAYIHSFEDFEQRFLIHSEYAVIIASPLSQKALNKFIPRLLVFLTSKPTWQNRFLFVLLGEVTVLSNLVVNDPIQFSINEWETKDENSWITLFDLIKITWKPHIDEHTILPNAINDSSQISSFNEQSITSANDTKDPPAQLKQSASVKSSVTRATQGSIVTVENLLFISDDPKNRYKSFNDCETNTNLTLLPYQEWDDNETNCQRIESNFELDNKRENFEYSFLPTDYQENDYAKENVNWKPYGHDQERMTGTSSDLSITPTKIEPSQININDSNDRDLTFEEKNIGFNENFKVYSKTRATQKPDVTVEGIKIINTDLQIENNQSCNESETNTNFNTLTNKYSDENKGAIGGAALFKLSKDLISVESNYDTDNESEGIFECFPEHNDFNDEDVLNENDHKTSREHGLYLIKELDDPATRNFNRKSKDHITEFEKDNPPTINVLLSTEEMKEPVIQSKLDNTGSSFSINDGDLDNKEFGDNYIGRERHDFKFSDKNDYLLRNPGKNVLIKSDATKPKEKIDDKEAFKQHYDIPEINLQGELLDRGIKKHRNSFSTEKGTLKYLNIKDLTDDSNHGGDELNESIKLTPDNDSNFACSIKSDEHISSELSYWRNVSEFDCSNQDPENLETNTNNDEFLDNTLEYSDLVIGNLAESGSNKPISQTRSKYESNFTSNMQETIDEDENEQSQLNLDSHFNTLGAATAHQNSTPINASSDSAKLTNVDKNVDLKDGGIVDQSTGTKDEFTTEMDKETNSKTFDLSDSDVDLSKRDTNKRREGEIIGQAIDKVSQIDSEGHELFITHISTKRPTKEHSNEVSVVVDKTADIILDENVCSISCISHVDENINDDNINFKSLGTSLNIKNISPGYLEEHSGSKKIESGFEANTENNIVKEQEWEDDLKLYLDSSLVINPKEFESKEIQSLEKDKEVEGRTDLKEFVDKSGLNSNAANKKHDYVDETGYNFGNIKRQKDQKDKKEKFIEMGYSEFDEDNLENKLNKEKILVENIDFKDVVFEIDTEKDDISGSLYNKLTSEDIPSRYLQWHEEIKIPTEFDASRDEDKVRFQIGDKILERELLHNNENTEDQNASRVSDYDSDISYREGLSSNVTGHDRSPARDNISFLMANNAKSDQLTFEMITGDLEILNNTITSEVEETVYSSLLSKDHEELDDVNNSDNCAVQEIENVYENFSDTDKNDSTEEEKRKQDVNEENKQQKRQNCMEDQTKLDIHYTSDRELEIKNKDKETISDSNYVREEKHGEQTDNKKTHPVDHVVDFASNEKISVKIDNASSSVNDGLNSKVTKYEGEPSFSTDLRESNKHGDRFKNEINYKSGSIFDDSNILNETRNNSLVTSSPTEELYVKNNEKSMSEVNDKTSHTSYNPIAFLSKFRLTRLYFWRNFFSQNPQTAAKSEDQLLVSERKSIVEYFRSPYCVLLVFVAGTLASPYWVAITKRISESSTAPEILTGTIISSVIHEEAVNRKYFILPVKPVRSLGVNSSSKLMLNLED